MAGISGMNNYNFMFNSGSNNNLAGLTNSLFGGGSGMLGEYAMIKSGTYKKLLTAYYKADKVNAGKDSTDTDTDTTKKSQRYDRFAEKRQTEAQSKKSETTNQYLTIKNEAADLRSSAYALNSYTLYKEKKAEDGTTSYDRDSINKAVKSFVSDYNTLLTAGSKANDLSMSGKLAGLVKETNSHADMLKSVGISIGKDNKLVLDEKVLASAEIGSFEKLFKGSGSYGDNVSFKASEIARQANSSAFNTTRASSYSQSGSYSVMGNKNNLLDQFL